MTHASAVKPQRSSFQQAEKSEWDVTTSALPRRIGERQVWWIRKPRSPRMNVRSAIAVWAFLLPVLAATLLLLIRGGQEPWPFQRTGPGASPTRGELLFRYELMLAAFVAYATIRSVPVWWRYRRIVLHDRRRIEQLLSVGRYREAAEHLHRYCLLYQAVWRRVPAHVRQWDMQIRPHLPPGPRLYLHHRKDPPSLPENPTAGFMPDVVAIGQPRWWTLLGLGLTGFTLLMLIVTVLEDRSKLYRLFSFNSVLLFLLLIGYGTFTFRWVLGRSNYLRFGPGVIQLIKYRILRREPTVETFSLQEHDVVLDLTGQDRAVTLFGRPNCASTAAKPRRFLFPRKQDVLESCLRSILSTAPAPPLDAHELVG